MNAEQTGSFDLQTEINWWLEHLGELKALFPGHYLLIRDQQVVMTSRSFDELRAVAEQRYGHRFFLVGVDVPSSPINEIGV